MEAAAIVIMLAYYSGFVSFYAGLLTLMLAIPLICTLDIRYREVPNTIWAIMVLVNLPFLYILYTSGLTWIYFVISMACIGIYCLLFALNGKIFGRTILAGSDILYLMTIAIIMPLSPMSYIPFQMIFYPVFAGISILLPIFIFISNYGKGYRIGNDPLNQFKVSAQYMFFHYPNEIPHMVPISLAVLISVFLGVFL